MPDYYTSDTRDSAEVNNVGRDQCSLSTGDIIYHVTHNHNYYPIRVACNHACESFLQTRHLLRQDAMGAQKSIYWSTVATREKTRRATL
ncbi:hypothetical protein FIBSPDRAFT_869363, partial [Athelia psychrophila]